MRMKSLIYSGVVVGLFVMLAEIQAGTVALRRTPILNVTLPTNTTYQVESSSNGSAWVATSVLVAGSGLPITLRLDGFSEQLGYRFSRIGTANVVTPVTTNGWHIAGAFPGASEVRVETNSTLATNTWGLRGFTFPDAAGSFVHALRPPFPAPTFFRGLQPATPLDLASIVSYSADPNSGYSGFGLVADDMPQLYQDGFICAPCPVFYHRGGSNAAAAGECYEFTGPTNTTIVMVGDMDDVAPPGTCDAGRTFFDLGNPAYAVLFPGPTGVGTATYRLVPAPVVGNVKLVVPQYFSGFYVELRPYNYRAGISKLEIRSASSATWTNLPRSAYNSFVHNGSALVFPLNVRVTSRFGEVVEFPPIASMSMNARFTASTQFVNFPELAPAPVWFQTPVYTDSLTNLLGGQWTTTPYSGLVVNPTFTNSAFQGTASLQISNITAFSGVFFNRQRSFPQPLDGVLEFAIRSGTGASVSNLGVRFASPSLPVLLPTIDATWRVIRIPLAPALAPAQIREFQIFNNANTPATSVLLDSIVFRQP